jgi:Secretion system C-terminal sorting domain
MNWKLLFVFSFCFVITDTTLNAQPCGIAQQLNASQQLALDSLSVLLDTAMKHEDLNDIQQRCAQIKAVLAAEAGIPEIAETYYPLTPNTLWLDYNTTLLASRYLIAQDSMAYVDLWKVGKGMLPPAYQPHSVPLRASAEIAAGLLKIAMHEADPARSIAYKNWALRALDSLKTMQLSSGAFPFPDLRPYNDPVFGPIIQNYLNSLGNDSVLVLQNGWIIDDSGTGEFKFDAGVIANAFYEAWVLTGDTSYQSVCIRTANYLRTTTLNINFNYNSFSVLGLTRAWQITGDTSYQNRALLNLEYGMLPGQLASGRWMDGHNARSVYHAIMIYNTIPLLLSTSQNHPKYPVVLQLVKRAVQNLNTYSYTCESATGFRWLIAAQSMPTGSFTTATSDSLSDYLGRHSQQMPINGRYTDIPTLGDYFRWMNVVAGQNQSTVMPLTELSVYPNPAGDILTITLYSEKSEDLYLSIYSISGQRLASLTYPSLQAGINTLTLPAQQLSQGMYFLQFTTATRKSTIPLLKK